MRFLALWPKLREVPAADLEVVLFEVAEDAAFFRNVPLREPDEPEALPGAAVFVIIVCCIIALVNKLFVY